MAFRNQNSGLLWWGRWDLTRKGQAGAFWGDINVLHLDLVTYMLYGWIYVKSIWVICLTCMCTLMLRVSLCYVYLTGCLLCLNLKKDTEFSLDKYNVYKERDTNKKLVLRCGRHHDGNRSQVQVGGGRECSGWWALEMVRWAPKDKGGFTKQKRGLTWAKARPCWGNTECVRRQVIQCG